jgi:endonuclease/exonuclease/phosphatase family metal-dependent hydrolase
MNKKLLLLIGLLLSLASFGDELKLKILSFNIYGLPRPMFKNPHYHQRIDRLCQTLKQTNHPHNENWDVIFFQEVLTKKIRKKLKNCGYPYWVDINWNGKRKEGLMQTGLFILSKYPVKKQELIKYSERGPIEGLESLAERVVHRSLQLAQIETPKGDVWLANTHLAPNFEPKGSSNQIARQAQFIETAEILRQKTKDQPFILGGDLNFGPIQPSYEPLWDEIPEIFPEIINSFNDAIDITFDSANSFNAKSISQGKLDHLFASQHFTARDGQLALNQRIWIKKKEFNYSDHYGWSREFTLP